MSLKFIYVIKKKIKIGKKKVAIHHDSFHQIFHKTFRPTDQPMNQLTRRQTTKFLELLGTANKFKEKTDTQPDTLVDIATYRTSEPRARFIENLCFIHDITWVKSVLKSITVYTALILFSGRMKRGVTIAVQETVLCMTHFWLKKTSPFMKQMPLLQRTGNIVGNKCGCIHRW